MLKRIRNTDSQTYFSCQIDEEMYVKGFLLRLTGLAGGSDTVLADLGRVKAWFQEKAIWDINVDTLIALTNLWGGKPEQEYVSTTFRYACYIPCGRRGDGNVMHIRPQDHFSFELTMNPNYDVATDSANDVALYADMEYGLQRYTLLLNENSFNLSASQDKSQSYVFENITDVYISDIVSAVLTLASTPMTNASISVGNQTSSVASIADWITRTNILANLEASTVTKILAELYAAVIGDDVNPSKLADAFSLYVQNGSGGAATPHVVIVGKRFEPDKLAATAADLNSKTTERFRAKVASNQGDTARVISTLRPGLGS